MLAELLLLSFLTMYIKVSKLLLGNGMADTMSQHVCRVLFPGNTMHQNAVVFDSFLRPQLFD